MIERYFLIDYYDKQNNLYIIYFPFNIKNYFQNRSLLKINKIGWGSKKDKSVEAVDKRFHFEHGFGIIVKCDLKKIQRTNKIQKYINNITKYLWYYYGIKTKSKTKFLFKKWE